MPAFQIVNRKSNFVNSRYNHISAARFHSKKLKR
jgi:hypothetical protein